MPAVRPPLVPGETELIAARHHPAAFLAVGAPAVPFLFAAAAAFGLGLAIPNEAGLLGIVDALVGLLALGLAIGGIVLLVGLWVRWRTVRVIVTDRRVVRTEGLSGRVTAETPLERIIDVVRRDGPLGERLGYGDLLLVIEGASPVDLRDLRAPGRIREAITTGQERMAAERAAARAAAARAAAGESDPEDALPPVVDALAGTAEALAAAPPPEPEPEPVPEPEVAPVAEGSDAVAGEEAAGGGPGPVAEAALDALAEVARREADGSIDAEEAAARRKDALDAL